MKQQKKESTITMTEEQLEKVIRTAVRSALRDMKAEEELPINEVDETKEATATYSLISLIAILFLGLILSISLFFAGAAIWLIVQNGFNLPLLLYVLVFIVISILSFLSMREVNNTKKIEVINAVFNLAMGLSSLIVAIVGVYFAYKSIKG